jgi:O-antigen/teichoic acid export membrane protein
LLAVALGVAGLPLGLIAAQVSGFVLTGVVAGFFLSRDLTRVGPPAARRLAATARRYWEFPVKGAPALLLNTLGAYLPLLLFAQFFGDAENGYFALARQCLLAVSAVLTTSTGQAFMLAATQCMRGGTSLRRLLLRQLARQTAIALGFLAGAVLVASFLFEWFFGPDWAPAGTYAIWLAFPITAALLVSPLSGLLLAADRVGLNAAWQVGHVVCTAALLLPSYEDPVHFLQVLLAIDALCYAVYLALILYCADRHDRRLRAA